MLRDLAEAELSAGLQDLARNFSLPVDDTVLHACLQHFQVLRKWNRVMNLVGDLSVESAIYRHYGESLFLAGSLGQSLRTVADLGSGAGFPGIGVAAMHPRVQVELIEARQKRCAFLRESTRSFPNVSVWNGVGDGFKRMVQMVVARAVDIGMVLDFADHRSADICLLIGESDAGKWRNHLESQGRQCAVLPVPWRPQSVVFSTMDADIPRG